MRETNAHPSLMDVECVNAAPAPRAFFKHVGRARAQTYVQWLDPEWSGDPQRPLYAKRCQTQTPYIVGRRTAPGARPMQATGAHRGATNSAIV